MYWDMGSGNTLIGPPDFRGNTIYNRGGTAIGSGACADPTSVAIGANAGGGQCGSNPPTIIYVPNNQGIVTTGQKGNNTINNYVLPRTADSLYQEGNKIAKIRNPRIAGNQVFFDAVGYTDYVDATKPIEFGNLLLHCSHAPVKESRKFVGTLSIMSVGDVCEIVGQK